MSALAYRAREGLRQAFLTMHLSDISDDHCRWVNEHLGAYVRQGLAKRDAAKVEDHLDECRRCTAMYLELTEVNSNLTAIIAPLLLGAAATGYLASTGSAGTAGALTLLGRVRDVIMANAGVAATGAAAAGVAAVATTAVLLTQGHPDVVVGADRPIAATTHVAPSATSASTAARAGSAAPSARPSPSPSPSSGGTSARGRSREHPARPCPPDRALRHGHPSRFRHHPRNRSRHGAGHRARHWPGQYSRHGSRCRLHLTRSPGHRPDRPASRWSDALPQLARHAHRLTDASADAHAHRRPDLDADARPDFDAHWRTHLDADGRSRALPGHRWQHRRSYGWTHQPCHDSAEHRWHGNSWWRFHRRLRRHGWLRRHCVAGVRRLDRAHRAGCVGPLRGSDGSLRST